MKHVVKHLHFVGIGGAGMSGIAEVLLTLGYEISGSDIAQSAATDRLTTLGARITLAHAAQNIAQADAVVVSSAISQDNPEIQAALQQHIPVISRAIMLAELMRLKQGIAIAGSHGKTTTTSLLVSVLAQGGLDPTFVIGGKLNSAGAHARLGAGDFIVAEADESDASFLNLFPVMEVITNIDADHLQTYGNDFARLKQAFVEFTQRLPFYGRVVLCIDDPEIRDILPHITKPMILYGLAEDAQVRAVDLKTVGTCMHFTVLRQDLDPLPIELNLLGMHNVQNALAAIAIASELEVPDEAIQYALSHFKGVGRRFQSYGELPLSTGGSYTLIDDYGHHPVEIAATLSAARAAWPDKRLVLAFEPHRFTRTRDCFQDLINVLGTADVLLLTEVYAASEHPIAGADGYALTQALRTKGKVEPVFIENVDDLSGALLTHLQDQDLVITMGAGSIEEVPKRLAALSKTPLPLIF